MYIETAFFRFNEALIRNSIQNHGFNEEQVRGLFAQSIVDELSSRFVPFPSLMVHLHKKYQLSIDVKKSLLVDIYTNFNRNAFDPSLSNYGFSSENYIEIKYFSGRRKEGTKVATTTNTSLLLKDILRLIILTGAKQFTQKLYLLHVFDQKPEKYLAFKTQGKGSRSWLHNLLDEAVSEKKLHINFEHEGSHFINQIGDCEIITDINLSLSTQTFTPKLNSKSYETPFLLYSYLTRIDDFNIKWKNKTLPASNSKETYDNCRELATKLWGKKKQ